MYLPAGDTGPGPGIDTTHRVDMLARIAGQLARAYRADLVSAADVERVCQRLVDAPGGILTITAARGFQPEHAAALWRPGRPVAVNVQFDGRLSIALQLDAVAAPTLEIGVGFDDDPADEALLDALQSTVDGDGLVAEWYCWFPGAAGGYNGVVLYWNCDADWSPTPGRGEVYVRVNYKSSDRQAIARRIAAHAAVPVDLDHPRWA